MKEPTMEELTPRILIIEDDPNFVFVLESILSAKYDLMVSLTGMEGLALARDNHPSLILLDILLPDMNGFEVCRRLKNSLSTCAVPVIFLTGLTDSDSIFKGFEAGGNDYVTKPINTPELLARTEAHIQLAHYKRLFRVCSYCNRLMIEEKWERWAPIFTKKTGIELTHGICPSCMHDLKNPKP